MDWLRRAVVGNPGEMQIMYSVDRGRRLTELELDHLEGHGLRSGGGRCFAEGPVAHGDRCATKPTVEVPRGPDHRRGQPLDGRT